MSTAWYKPNRIPRKIRSWTASSLGTTPSNHNPPGVCRSIEVWETTCVVTNMNAREGSGNDGEKSSHDEDSDSISDSQTPFSVLINPGNPSLSGVAKFAYFPVGGPEPPPSFQIGKDSHPIMGYVTTWGGMEVGQGMAFASNTVDGMVHQYGGKDLRKECQAALGNTWWWMGGGRKQPLLEEGQAVSTPVVGPKLKEVSGYDLLVHTVPPFCGQDYRCQPPREHDNDDNGEAVQNDETETNAIADHNNFLLAECYRNSLRMATLSQSQPPLLKIACPLLGAGCRGFPVERAIDVAAKATTQWMVQASTWNDTNGNTSSSTRNDSSRSSSWNGWLGGGSNNNNNGASSERSDESLQHPSITLAFGIPDGDIRQQLIEAIDREMKKVQAP